mgnify:FL=1
MKRKAASCLLVLAAIMTMTPTIPTLAAENPDNTTQETTTTGTQGATITYEQDSAFTVTIPKTITLGQNKSATYGVKVNGDISGNETVTVTPDATLQLTDSNGKAAVTGTITQDITEFAADQVNLPDGGSTTGNIVANELTSGDWSGNFEFAIGINKELVAGLYDADGKMVCTWEESGIDVCKDYAFNNYKTDPASAYSVLQAKPEVKSIVMPDSVTSIGNYAFYGCSSLTNITIPDSITSIGNNTFYNCSSLTDVAVPNGVTSIGSYAFYGCSNLTSIAVPDGVISLGDHAFSRCSGLTAITIPNSVTNIKDSAFSRCTSLTSITVSTSVTSIESGAFSGCISLASITIPDRATSIGNGAFNDCISLASVTYKGQTYTSKSTLTTAFGNNVTLGTNPFSNTALTD